MFSNRHSYAGLRGPASRDRTAGDSSGRVRRSSGKFKHNNFAIDNGSTMSFSGANFYANLYALPTGTTLSALRLAAENCFALTARDSSKVVRGVEPERVDASSGSLFQAMGTEVYNSQQKATNMQETQFFSIVNDALAMSIRIVRKAICPASLRYVVLGPIIAFSLAACGALGHIEELQDSRHINNELSYAGFELKWRDVSDSDFIAKYEQELSEQMNRRVPRVLKGNRPIKIVVVASELHNPNVLARNLPFNNPSIKIEVIFRDAANEDVISRQSDDLADILLPSGDGISFRLHSVPARLAGATMQSIMKQLKKL